MSFTYTMPLNVNVVTIKGEEHLFVEGDISTTDIDLVNDIMTKECQESMQKQILDSNMKLDLEHEAFRGDSHEEKEINKTKIPAGKITDATVEDLGDERYSTRVKAEINRNNPDYKMIKGNLLEKYLDAFSVAFLPIDVKNVERDGQQVQLLNNVKLLNVALTGNPCNTKAQLNEVFMKSMSALEEYKKMKEIDPSIERALRVKSTDNKSHSPDKIGMELTKFKKNSKKMTDEPNTEGQEGTETEGNEPEGQEDVTGDVEQKAMLKNIAESLKSMNEKYDATIKENEAMKESVIKNAESIAEIMKALKNPIHKSQGATLTDEEMKAKAGTENKSVDPLELCH